jgi:hypothetical protein
MGSAATHNGFVTSGCGEPPRAIVHIGVLISGVADGDQLSFFATSPDSIMSAPEFKPETDCAPAICRNRQVDHQSFAFAREKTEQTCYTCARRPAVSRHFADPYFLDIPEHFGRHLQISFGVAAGDRDRLDPFHGFRNHHVAGDDTGLAAFCIAHEPPPSAGATRCYAGDIVIAFHLRVGISSHR